MPLCPRLGRGRRRLLLLLAVVALATLGLTQDRTLLVLRREPARAAAAPATAVAAAPATAADGQRLLGPREPAPPIRRAKQPEPAGPAAAAARGTVPTNGSASAPGGCVGWRQTGGCSPTGGREAAHDLSCAARVRGSASGYCECAGGRRANAVGCFHKEFTCELVCGGAPEWQLPPWDASPLTVAEFERSAAGARCHRPGNTGVLVAAPFARDMHESLRRQLFANLLSLECANKGFNLHFALYDEPFQNNMDARKTRKTGRAVLATIRNRLVQKYLEPAVHEYILWLDADVVQYPPDLVARLRAVSDGIVAPLALIEGSDLPEYHQRACRRRKHSTWGWEGRRLGDASQPPEPCAPDLQTGWEAVEVWAQHTARPFNGLGQAEDYPRPGQFYDRAGFMPSGTPVSHDRGFPGSAQKWPPYLGEAGSMRRVPCEGVGTVYLIPTAAYTNTTASVEHFPTAFTEHFPVVHAAKYGLGMAVTTALDVVVLHADLPSYGLKWHKEPMSLWAEWLEPYFGRDLAEVGLRVTRPPSEWCEGENEDVSTDEAGFAVLTWPAIARITRRPSCKKRRFKSDDGLFSPPRCSCGADPASAALCRPLPSPAPARDVHVYSDCSSPPSPDDPRGCSWRGTLNLSAVTTVVDGSKNGGQLSIAVDGGVSWRTASVDSELVCAAHAHGVRVLPIVGPSVHKVKGEKSSFDYRGLLSNASAVARAANELASLATAAGYDGVEFDLEGIGAPFETPSTFDFGTAYLGLVGQTRAAVRRAQPHGRVTVTVGLNNISSKVERPVFAAYPVDKLSKTADAIFIMAYDMWHSHAYCAGPNSPLPTVESNLRGWIAAGAERSKLILGIPWYGRSYYCLGNMSAVPKSPCSTEASELQPTCTSGDKKHPSPHGPAPSLWAIEKQLQLPGSGCVRRWSESWSSPYMDCSPKSGPRVQTWYDDANSTALKVALANRLQLGGVGIFTAEMAGSIKGEQARQAWDALTSFRAEGSAGLTPAKHDDNAAGATATMPSDPCAFPAELKGSNVGQATPPAGLVAAQTVEQQQAAVDSWLAALESWRESCRAGLRLNGSVYDLPQLKWTQSSWIQPQIHPWDNFFWDPTTRNYTIGRYLADCRERYGGIDAVLVWPTFPQLGLDDRNQFDYIRSMPGGVDGLRSMVRAFHSEGVKVLLPYNPWDKGVRSLCDAFSRSYTIFLTKAPNIADPSRALR